MKYGQDFINKECFKYIPDIRKIPEITNINDEILYEYFELTNEEQQMINNLYNNNDEISIKSNASSISSLKSALKIKIRLIRLSRLDRLILAPSNFISLWRQVKLIGKILF